MLLIIQSGVTIKEEWRGKMWEGADIPANMDFCVTAHSEFTVQQHKFPIQGSLQRKVGCLTLPLHTSPTDKRKQHSPGLSV